MPVLLRLLLFAACWSAAHFSAVGDIPPTAVFERLSRADGLSSDAVHCLLQDRQGFLWIGTEDGLNRYDGHTFKVYRHQPGKPDSLPSNFVYKLYETRDGMLWIGLGQVGFCRYDPSTDAFFNYEVKSPHDGRRPNVLNFYEDRRGFLWVCTDAGLVRLDRRRNELKLYDLPRRDFSDSVVVSVCEDELGRLWVGGGQGLFRLDEAEDRMTLVLPPVRRRKSETPSDFYGWSIHGRTPEGRLRLCLAYVGVALFDPVRERFVAQFDLTGTWLDALPTEAPALTSKRYLLLWDQDEVWLAEPDGTAYRLDLQRRACQVIEPAFTRPTGFTARRLLSMMRDRSGVLWFCDGVMGLMKFSPTHNRFELHQHHPFDAAALSNGYVRGVCEDRAGRVWVATQYGGLNRLDRRTGRATHYRARPNSPQGLRSDQVWAVYEDRQGVLWVGTQQGLQKFDPARGVFETLPALPDRVHVNVVYEDPRGGLWVGCQTGECYEISPDRRTSRNRAPDLKIGEPTESGRFGLGKEVQAIYASRQDGRLWVGLPNGAVRYDPATKDARVYRVDGRPEYGAPYVTHFVEDAAGTLWMVTKGAGLCRFDPQRETFIHITEKDGLPHNNCYAMFPDAEGGFWLSSDAGVSRFDPARMTFRTYTPADGLQGREFNRFSAFQNAKGEIFFGGTNGLNIFRPADLADNLTPPPVAVTELKINGQARPAVEGMRLTLDYDQNAIDIGYAGLDFNVPEDNRYRCRLEGFDRGWREVGTRREASYTNLPPGRYRFWAAAANHDGVWSAEKVLMELEIRPPWWRTWPAYFGFALAGGLALYGGVRLRLRQLTAQNRRLEIKIAERTAEITRQNQELEARNQEIEAQRRDILESLTYAQAIQQAMLPSEELLTAALGEHFVLWRPRDIVSGDFYWLHRRAERVILVVADCTGHGVPGALMAMIGHDLLGQIVVQQGVHQPAHILDALDDGVRRALRQDESEQLPDGMDVAVCTIDCAAPSLTFAGARRSLYVAADGVLTEHKGDRQSVGGVGRERRNRRFTHHVVTAAPGAMLYLATDGFADQPDERGKKFGTRRFLDLLTRAAALPAARQRTMLEAELAAHSGGERQRDDITVLGVRWRCAAPSNGRPDQRA